MIRDEEIKRLKLYAKGMGFKVVLRHSNNPSSDADFEWEKNLITIYVNSTKSKKEIVVLLIHEIAHAKAYILNNRTVSKRMDKTYTIFNNTNTVPEYIRAQVLKDETKDSKLWETIICDCDIKLDKNYIEFCRDYDLSFYELWYLTGDAPTIKERKALTKLLKGIHNVR